MKVGTSIAEAERRLILATLEHFEGDKKKAGLDAPDQPQDPLQPPERLPRGRLSRRPSPSAPRRARLARPGSAEHDLHRRPGRAAARPPGECAAGSTGARPGAPRPAAAATLGVRDLDLVDRAAHAPLGREARPRGRDAGARPRASRRAAAAPGSPRARCGTSSRPSPCTRSSRRARRGRGARRRRPPPRRAPRCSARASARVRAWLIGFSMWNSSTASSPLPRRASAIDHPERGVGVLAAVLAHPRRIAAM